MCRVGSEQLASSTQHAFKVQHELDRCVILEYHTVDLQSSPFALCTIVHHEEGERLIRMEP